MSSHPIRGSDEGMAKQRIGGKSKGSHTLLAAACLVVSIGCLVDKATNCQKGDSERVCLLRVSRGDGQNVSLA